MTPGLTLFKEQFPKEYALHVLVKELESATLKLAMDDKDCARRVLAAFDRVWERGVENPMENVSSKIYQEIKREFKL